MTRFAIGMIAAGLWVSVMVGTAVYLRSAPRSPRQSIREYRLRRQSIGRVPVVVRSLSRNIKGAEIRVTSNSLGKLETAPAGAQTLHSGIPLLRSRSKKTAEGKAGRREKSSKQEQQDTPPKVLSDFFNHPGESNQKPLQFKSADPNVADALQKSPKSAVDESDEMPEHSRDRSTRPAAPIEKPFASLESSAAGVGSQAQDEEDTAKANKGGGNGSDMDSLLGWINAGSPKVPGYHEPLIAKPVAGASRTAPGPGPKPKTLNKTKPVPVAKGLAVKKVDDISYVLVDDEGRPLLD